jgi:hypothetical protein
VGEIFLCSAYISIRTSGSNLLGAAHNRPGSEDLKELLEVARYGVKQRLASFPLSATHYMETLRRRDAASRHRLAMVMAEFSRFHTIASPEDVLPGELDRGLRERYGKPRFPRPLQVFGVGAGHAFGRPDLRYRLPEDLGGDAYSRARLEEWAALLLEHAVLAGPPEGVPVPGMLENDGYRTFGRPYVEAEKKLAKGFRQYDPERQHLADWTAASELIDILEPLNEAFARAGIISRELPELDTAEGMTRLLMDLPSRAVVYELRRLRHEDGNTQWESNDLYDLSVLAVAIPYCDVVVTENQWCHMATRAQHGRRFDTVVLDDLRKLTAVLAAA